MTISTDAEKSFDKIQHPFTIKCLQKAGTEGTYLSISEVTQSCPTLCDPTDYSTTDPTDYSTTGLPVHHQLPEFILTHVH